MDHVHIIASLILALAAAGLATLRASADVPVEDHHHHCRFPARRPDRHGGARARRPHEGNAWPARAGGERRPAPPAPSAPRRVARAAPDGHTLNVGQWTSNVGAACAHADDLRRHQRFRAGGAPDHVATSGSSARPRSRRRTCKELIAWLKANPDKASAAIGRRRQRRPHLPDRFHEQERHQVHDRAISRAARR